MIALLVSLAVFGLVTARLMPNLAVLNQREDEIQLRETIARIRNACDVARIASSAFDPNGTLDSITVADNLIASLVKVGLLPDHPADKTIPGYQWGSGSNTWMIIQNLASNTSFQIMVPDPDDSSKQIPASWTQSTPDTVATVTTKSYPSQQSGDFDDYPGQNKLGNLLETGGASLEITR